MTIEEEFFKCFEIEPKELEYPDNFEYYPEITSDILLELICIIIKDKANYSLHLSTIKNIKDLKNEILNQCIKNRALIKHQVQPLFKEIEQ